MWRTGTGGVPDVTVAGFGGERFVPRSGPHWARSVGATLVGDAKNWSWYGALITSTARACWVSWSNDTTRPTPRLPPMYCDS